MHVRMVVSIYLESQYKVFFMPLEINLLYFLECSKNNKTEFYNLSISKTIIICKNTHFCKYLSNFGIDANTYFLFRTHEFDLAKNK